MKIIEPSVSLVKGNVFYTDRPKHVELCGRVCYKSEDKITDDSAEKFIASAIERGHEAVLEHARITLNLTKLSREWNDILDIRNRMRREGINDYLTGTGSADSLIISGNVRAWRNFSKYAKNNGYMIPRVIQRMWHEDGAFFPEFIKDDDSYINDMLADVNPIYIENPKIRLRHTWYTLRFICDRGVSHEIVRHRPVSYCQESTRYCNYSKDGFGNEITVIKPRFFARNTKKYAEWKAGCEQAEEKYFNLLELGATSQEARDVLPTSLKTELVMTATADEWLHFINLRARGTTGKPHPQMCEVATQAEKILMDEDGTVFGNG